MRIFELQSLMCRVMSIDGLSFKKKRKKKKEKDNVCDELMTQKRNMCRMCHFSIPFQGRRHLTEVQKQPEKNSNGVLAHGLQI